MLNTMTQGADAFRAEPAERIDGRDQRAAFDGMQRELLARTIRGGDFGGYRFGVGRFADDDLHACHVKSAARLAVTRRHPRRTVADDALDEFGFFEGAAESVE